MLVGSRLWAAMRHRRLNRTDVGQRWEIVFEPYDPTALMLQRQRAADLVKRIKELRRQAGAEPSP